MYEMKTRFAIFACLLAASFMPAALPISAFAKGGSAPITAAAIKNVVLHEDTLESEYKQQVYAAYANGVASVSLFRHPEATRDDCKINAVLLARKIIELDPRDVKLIRVVFYDYDRQNRYWEVEVRAQLVNAFAQREIGENELIDSILLTEDQQKNPLSSKFAALSYSGIINHDSVCRGACEGRRLAIHLRLKELSKQKIELGHFRDDFLRIEDAARRGKDDAELPVQITALNKSLDDYVQELIKSGQLPKPELRRAKNAIGSHGETKPEPLLGL